MAILITGGCGYIGSHTAISLMEAGHTEVISIDNLSNSSLDTIDRVEAIAGIRMVNYAIDLVDESAIATVFNNHPNITGVIHFAALKAVGESVENPLHYYHNNLTGLVLLLKACVKHNIQQFIFSSSCTVYGEVDPAHLPVTEQTATQVANSPYGWTKVMGEQIMRDFLHTAPTGFQGIALRYFNPVGAHPSGTLGELPLGRPSNLVPFITQCAAGLLPPLTVFGHDYPTRDGTCIRDYIHVCDIARAHVRAMEHLAAGKQEENFDIFNLGSGNGTSVLEAIEAFEQASGLKLPHVLGDRRPGDVTMVYADNRKAVETLGWELQHDTHDMMASAWKWQQYLQTQT